MYKISEINDKNIWDSFIRKVSPQSYFQSYNFGEAAKMENISVQRIGVFKHQELIAVAQITPVKAKRGRFLHIRNGPVVHPQNLDCLKYLFTEIERMAKKVNASFIRISPLIAETPENKQILKSLGFQNAPIHAMDGEYVWVLDLDKPKDELLQNMRKTTRYLIKKGQKMGVEVIQSSDLKDFFSLYHETSRRHGFVEHKGIENEFNIFHKEGNAILYTGKYQGKLIAGAVIVFYANQAVYRHGASAPSGIPASYLIQWEAINEAKSRGLPVYNFFGIAPPEKKDHPWAGITLFKTGFGGRPVSYIHTLDKVLSARYALTYSVELLRKISKGY